MAGISLIHYLGLAAVIFVIGVIGFMVRRNAITVFMSIELMLNAVNLTLLAFARHSGNDNAHSLVLFIITIAAAEAAVGLAIIIQVFRRRRTTQVDKVDMMRH